MLTNTEIQEIITAVDEGTYDIASALNDIATAAKGEDVRKALYAEAYTLNKEGHTGSTDLRARERIAQLNTAVRDLDADKAEKTTVEAVDARMDTLIGQIQVGTNEVKLFEGSAKGIGTVITLSDNLSNYDYLDVYVDKHGVTDILTIPATFTGDIKFRFTNIADTQPDTGLDIDELSLRQTSETTLLINNESNWHWSGAANATAVHTLISDENTDSSIAHIVKIVGRKNNSQFVNAELEDIRVGADGTEHNTAGAAVRTQVSEIHSEIGDLSNLETEDQTNLVAAINEAASTGGGGMTEAVKAALLQIAQKVAYIDQNGQNYYNALYNALYPLAELVSIAAVYTQSGTVYTTDTLDTLKTDLVVTATYDDLSTRTVSAFDYTLSGTLTEGTSTITVSYGGKTTTFDVTVTAEITDTTAELRKENYVLAHISAAPQYIEYSETNGGITIMYDMDTPTTILYPAGIVPTGTPTIFTDAPAALVVYDANGDPVNYVSMCGSNSLTRWAQNVNGTMTEYSQSWNISEYSKIAFSVDTRYLDDAYMYDKTSGQVWFAGINTPYYGMSNISEASV